jgi:hypothetical protein
MYKFAHDIKPFYLNYGVINLMFFYIILFYLIDQFKYFFFIKNRSMSLLRIILHNFVSLKQNMHKLYKWYTTL